MHKDPHLRLNLRAFLDKIWVFFSSWTVGRHVTQKNDQGVYGDGCPLVVQTDSNRIYYDD